MKKKYIVHTYVFAFNLMIYLFILINKFQMLILEINIYQIYCSSHLPNYINIKIYNKI